MLERIILLKTRVRVENENTLLTEVPFSQKFDELPQPLT